MAGYWSWLLGHFSVAPSLSAMKNSIVKHTDACSYKILHAYGRA